MFYLIVIVVYDTMFYFALQWIEANIDRDCGVHVETWLILS